jgi:predicted ferric reductase
MYHHVCELFVFHDFLHLAAIFWVQVWVAAGLGKGMRPFIVNQKVLATEQHDERCLEFLMHTIRDKVMPESLTNLHVPHRHLPS